MGHGEWEIIGNSSVAWTTEPGVTFIFMFRRKPLFFMVNIIFPILVMSLLNILVFAIPPTSGDRISYSITVLLAIAVFLTMVGDNLPKTSKPMSVLSYFLTINLTLSALVCFFAIMNLRIYTYESKEQLPAWAYFVARITTKSKRQQKKRDEPLEQDVVEHMPQTEDYEMSLKAGKDIDNTRYKNNRDQFTWIDVSKSVDIICLLLFLLFTVVNTLSFMLVVTGIWR